MTMEKLKKCRICLVDNVRMCVVANKNLQEIYFKLTDVPFVTEDSRPMLACFFCCSRLKQSYQLQRKCLEAEELFSQMLNVDYETKPLINQGQLELCSGFTITPTVHISIVNECQTENIAVKEELPAVCEALNIVEPKEEPQSDELEPENFDNSCLDPLHHPQSDLEDDILLMEFKIEVEEKREVSNKKQRARKTKKLEPENIDISVLDVTDAPHLSESDLEDGMPLVEFKTEVEEEQEVSKMRRRAKEAKRATVAKKPKLDTQRTKLEYAITAEQIEKSDSKLIRITQKRTSKPETYFKEPYKCDQRSFNPVKKNIQHTRTQLRETPYKCDVCQRSLSNKSSLTNHKRIHTGESPYKCDLCQRSFRQSSNLKTHIRQHTGEKAYKCDLCQRSFSEKSILTNHIRIHTGEKPFKCDICQRSFRQNSNLTTHIRQHTGEKPYKCDVCQRSFSQKWDLIKHNRLHTGEKPYKCDACQRSFTQKSGLTKHIRIHTGEKPYECNVCKRSFRYKRDLTKHSCIYTGEKPFECM